MLKIIRTATEKDEYQIEKCARRFMERYQIRYTVRASFALQLRLRLELQNHDSYTRLFLTRRWQKILDNHIGPGAKVIAYGYILSLIHI